MADDKFQDTFSPVPSFVAGEQPKATKYSRWAAQTDNALATLERAVGNMWASTIISGDIRPMLFTSLSRAVGNMEWVNPYIPAYVDVDDHEEFTPASGREFYLELFPQDTAYTLGSWLTISNDTAIDPTQWQTSRADLAVNGDWTHIGRKIYTYAELGTEIIGGSDRIITYHGETREGDLGMGFGVFPNLSQVEAGANTGCIVTQRVDGFGETYYEVDMPDLIVSKQLPGEVGYEEPPVGTDVQLQLPEQCTPPTGETDDEIPTGLAMLWDVGDDRDIPNMGPISNLARYYAISATRLEIRNVTLDGFASELDGEINNTRYVLVTMGQSLAEAFGQMWKRFLNHTHGVDSFGAPMSHTDLAEAVFLQQDINGNPLAWVKSYATQPIIFNNNHPQFLYREGFQNDPGTYYNSMVGDLNLASEDENVAGDGSTDYHQNFDWDTVKLLFYGIGGPSIFYSTPRGGSQTGQLERLVFRGGSIDKNVNPDTLTGFDGGFQFGYASDIAGSGVANYWKLQAEFLGPVDILNYLRVRQVVGGPAPIITFDASCERFDIECETNVTGDLNVLGNMEVTGDMDVTGFIEFFLSDAANDAFVIYDLDNASAEAFRFEALRAVFNRNVEADTDVTFDGVDLDLHSHREGLSEGGRVPVEGIDRVGDRTSGSDVYTPVRINSAGYAVYAP